MAEELSMKRNTVAGLIVGGLVALVIIFFLLAGPQTTPEVTTATPNPVTEEGPES